MKRVRRSKKRAHDPLMLAASAHRPRSQPGAAFCSGIKARFPVFARNGADDDRSCRRRARRPERGGTTRRLQNMQLEGIGFAKGVGHVADRRKGREARPAKAVTTAPAACSTTRRCLSRANRASHRPQRPPKRIRCAAAKRGRAQERSTLGECRIEARSANTEIDEDRARAASRSSWRSP